MLKSLASQGDKVCVSMRNQIAIDVQTTCQVWHWLHEAKEWRGDTCKAWK